MELPFAFKHTLLACSIINDLSLFKVNRCVFTCTALQVVEIDPTCESLFPGITEMKRELEVGILHWHKFSDPALLTRQAWQWNYGKSPKFTVSGRETFQYGDLVSVSGTGHLYIAPSKHPHLCKYQPSFLAHELQLSTMCTYWYNTVCATASACSIITYCIVSIIGAPQN